MTIFQSILLGIVQGLTEFVPISSSAHLVIVPYLLGWKFPPEIIFVFDVLIQLATLLAVLIFFWKDIYKMIAAFLHSATHDRKFQDGDSRLAILIVVATVPAIVLGIPLKKLVESSFESPILTAFFLLGTAALLFIAEHWGKFKKKLAEITWLDAILVGFFQVIAFFPGISRSGATISGGILRGVDRPSAAKFSFLMSIPAMLGAGLLAGLDLLKIPDLGHYLKIFLPGFLVAAVTGIVAIRWLLGYLQKHKLTIFAVYCLTLTTIVLLKYYLSKL